MLERARGLFITGTDTDVGKTYVTAFIARQLVAQGQLVGAYKPVCSGSQLDVNGNQVWHDVEQLAEATGGRFDPWKICPQRFAAPLAPPVAARMEGRSVDSSLVVEGVRNWEQNVDYLLIEGVGGLLSPLSEELTVADLAVALGYPLLIVARIGLGTINHTLLTAEAAQRRGLSIAGIVLNEASPTQAAAGWETNPAEIASRCHAPVLGVLRFNDLQGLTRDGARTNVDWAALAKHKTP